MMPNNPERSVNSDLPKPREFERPSEALTGGALVEKMQEEMARICAENSASTRLIDGALHHIVEAVETVKPGEPVILLSGYDERVHFEQGGIAIGEPYAIEKYGHWGVYIPFRHADFNGKIKNHVSTKTAWQYLRDEQSPEYATKLLVGEEAVRAYTEAIGRSITDGELTRNQIKSFISFFQRFQTSTLGYEYFNISDDVRYNLVNAILDYVVEQATDYMQSDAIETIKYLADITEPEQLDKLFEVVEEQWASLLELDVEDERRNIVGMVKSSLDMRTPPDTELGMSLSLARTDRQHDIEMMHCNKMAELYAIRARQEHAVGAQRQSVVALPKIEVAEPPTPRDLSIFTAWKNENTITEDIRYLRELRAAGYTVPLAVERDEDKMYRGIAALVEHSLADVTLESRLEIFEAMEFLFDLKREEQREELYRLLCKRYAIKIPLEGRQPIKGYIGVAEAIGTVMPNPPQAPDGTPYEGPARTAALLSLMYRNRAHQLSARYTPTNEHEEG